jgi:selT/selW/selH-like putative selenoprotein
LAASLRKEFGVDAELIRGSGGVFDVHVDGKSIFSKHDMGRFPHEGEVEELIRASRK